jgi:hypothetical protein
MKVFLLLLPLASTVCGRKGGVIKVVSKDYWIKGIKGWDRTFSCIFFGKNEAKDFFAKK